MTKTFFVSTITALILSVSMSAPVSADAPVAETTTSIGTSMGIGSSCGGVSAGAQDC